MDAPKMRMGWGSAASPVLHDGRLYIVNDNEERSFIAAFNARTGEQLLHFTGGKRLGQLAPELRAGKQLGRVVLPQALANQMPAEHAHRA